MTLDDLQPLPGDITPISLAEREARIEKARRLMVAADMDAIFVEGGTSLQYFLGVKWGCSERLTAAVIPAKGDIVYVCPAFEEAHLRQLLLIGDTVRTWEEDESPYACVARILDDLQVAPGTVGIEQQVRFFIFDGLRRACPRVRFVSADPVTVGCRAFKSPAEIALMQRAMNNTVAAYKYAISQLREGITRAECLENSRAAYRALGVQGIIDFQFAENTTFPHGGPPAQTLKEGDVVLMDGNCTVEGYYSDISRTLVFGTPTQLHRDIWELEKRAQAAAFDAAQPGAPCEAVDAAARKVIVDAGFGPEYAVPGLPHRTGHGIGMKIHEPENMVRGNTTLLAPGLCFSNEPMIVTGNGFGVRLEDCVYMTEDGPKWFTEPSPSIEQPFA